MRHAGLLTRAVRPKLSPSPSLPTTGEGDSEGDYSRKVTEASHASA